MASRCAPEPDEPEFPEPVVFRVRRREVRKALLAFLVFSWIAFLVCGGGGAIAVGALRLPPVRARPVLAVLLGAGVMAAAIAAARHLRVRVTCSDPACDGVPGPDDPVCPGCRCEIVGTISSQRERLAAEERAAAGSRGSRRRPADHPSCTDPRVAPQGVRRRPATMCAAIWC